MPLQPEDKPSNGVQGYNSTAINVCYIGGVDDKGRAVDNRTTAQKEALRTILKDLHSRYPDAEILGHRDIWGSNPKDWHKQCPCFNVKEWWNEVNKEPEPEEVQEPIQESEEVVLEEPVVESGEIVVTGKESSHSGIPEENISRPNPVHFIFEFVKLLFKIIFKIK